MQTKVKASFTMDVNSILKIAAAEIGTGRAANVQIEATSGSPLTRSCRSAAFRIVHFSIQGTHLHLIVEAKNRTALSKGMKAFLISAAKQINAAIFERTGTRRRGQVFTDRFHMRILKTPREVRNAVAYVLNN